MRVLTRTMIFAMSLMIYALTSFAQSRQLNIVFIGNSITYGAGVADRDHNSPPAQAAAWLKAQKGIDSVRISNQGHSGYTTLDFTRHAGI